LRNIALSKNQLEVWENPQILDTIIANEKKTAIDGIHVDGDDDELV
jgi:hypothetical protein